MVVVGMTEDLAKCIRRFARIVKKNVKSLLNLEKIVRFIARTVFQSIKMAAVNFNSVLQANQKPVRLTLAGFFLFLLMGIWPVWAQDGKSSNDIIVKMTTDLNLQQDQVTNITPIIEKYTIAFADLQKSIDDGAINPSAIESQRQGLKAAEAQELSQYLTANQISQWNYIQSQEEQKEQDNSDINADADADRYSNLPGQ